MTTLDERTAPPVIEAWTGHHATALRAALRMSQMEFAEHLGVSLRVVAKWASNSGTALRQDTQRCLDTAYDRTTPAERARFVHVLDEPQPAQRPTGPGFVGLTTDEDAVRVVVNFGDDRPPLVMPVDEAERVARAVLRQVATAHIEQSGPTFDGMRPALDTA